MIALVTEAKSRVLPKVLLPENMLSWWGKSSSKEAKPKATKEGFINSLHKKLRSPETKSSSTLWLSRKHASDTVSQRGSLSRAVSRSPSPSSKNVGRCQSFQERSQSQPLPLPSQHRTPNVSRTDSGLSESVKAKSRGKVSKTSYFFSLPRPACIRQKMDSSDADGEVVVASICSECSIESDDPVDSRQPSAMENNYDIGCNQSSLVSDQSPVVPLPVPVNLLSKKSIFTSPPKRRHLHGRIPHLLVPNRGAFCNDPDSSMSSPSRTIMGTCAHEQVRSSGKFYLDFPFLGSGQCSSPGSGQTSGHNSMGGDMSGQLFWHHSRGSPEYSPNPSPRITSPGPCSKNHSGAVTPRYHRADESKQRSHPLPLPPLTICNSSPFSHQNSAATSPSVPRSPARAENLTSPGSRWKKGKLLGQGTFGHVYVGFNSETGEMCAMKEVTLFADDAKSKESAKQLGQEIALLSRLRHPNIVQYYGSEMVGDKLCIYLEYVSGGSIRKILQEYGKLGESAIRSYTQQILSGLAYLHAQNTVHRDIKGANILVDPNGRVKLADFGMAKHITGQTSPLSFRGSPYWMAPEVIRNSNGCSLAVDIWSLGCTVLEMATSKPPWSEYEGVAAMFKIGNSKELPTIPDYLSEEGKHFVRLCLQRNPLDRSTAAQLLGHPFVKNAPNFISSDNPQPTNTLKSGGNVGHAGTFQRLDAERLAIHSFRVSKSNFHSRDIHITRNISCPVSPIGSPLLYLRSPQHLSGMMSPSSLSSPVTTSGSSTPITGGFGTIPYQLISSSKDGFVHSCKNPPGPCIGSCPSNWDLGGVHSGFRSFQEPSSLDNKRALGKNFRNATNGELNDTSHVRSLNVPQSSSHPINRGG